MIIYVLRHGQAEAQISSDDARRLTPTGIIETEAVLASRVSLLAGVAEIWASPLVRAQQTAQLARQYLPGIPLQTTALLVPESEPEQLIDWLYQREAEGVESILLVSHQPLVGRLLALLCGKPEGFYPMGTSSLAAITLHPVAAGLGDLLWLDHATR
ncbi:phosphohistidine phosphatase SixA [Cellvibrio mixtus]|uniref:Phosphohistidine phosphatase SixA n=1 Tax=Cellvibrio mixtus TaxID=39650 RepID=A0A266Q5B8_9GAMM|nr:phosphohistidine phosphatase SixA [Cellvibrio mixtus]OZY85078.1 phosphohistidine phosphatase SixA [Cellvibrio mixtus]